MKAAVKKKRKYGGRKPSTDKAIQVSFYVKESKVKAVGGMESARELCRIALIKSADNGRNN